MMLKNNYNKIWFALFCFMVLLMLLLDKFIFSRNNNVNMAIFIFSIGVLILEGWFLLVESENKCNQSLSTNFILTFILVLALLCISLILVWAGNKSISIEFCRSAHLSIRCIGVLISIIGILGLVMAKLYDRRWRAIYILGFTTVMFLIFFLSIFQKTNLDKTIALWWLPYLKQSIYISLLGIIGTIVSFY